jgi:hypothetical protein
MPLFDIFETKEALQAAIESAITESDGKFSLGEVVTLKNDFDKKTGDHRKSIQEKDALRKEKSELEKLKKDLDDKIELLEKKTPAEEVEKQLLELKKQVRDIDSLKTQNAEMLGQINEFKTKETRTSILSKITDAMTSAKIRPEELKRANLYVSEFQIDDSGDVITADGTRVNDYFNKLVKENPHWLAQSKGGGSQNSTGNNNNGGDSFDQKLQELKKTGNVVEMIKAGLTHTQ